MKIFPRFTQTLAFKIGSTIVIAEIFVLVLTGILYVNNFSAEIDRRISGQVQLPGKLMQAGLLKFDSIADEKTMRDLVGEELVNGVVVGTNKNVFYALNPSLLGQNVGAITGIDATLFKADITSATIIQRAQRIISISPVFGADKRTLRFYVYVEASTSSAQAQKTDLVRVFLLGSLVTIVLTSVILYIAFTMTIFSRINGLLLILKRVENGDLAARVSGTINADEVGILQRGVNSMIGRLQEFVATLEQRVRERTKELELARQAAEAASNTKSVFLSNMSHELRTPLNMVIGYASSMLNMPQMYSNQQLPEIFRNDMLLIQENGRYLLELINDILDLSKIEAEKLTLDLQAVNLVELFRGVIATSLGLVKDKALQLRPDFPNELPVVWADPVRVRQILLNLMSNAIKFTESGSVTLFAKVQGGSVFIAVIDTGIGIPENALSTIFDRYEQIKSQVEGKHSGTGLGLDISQRLCQMHGSRLNVSSTLGQGSSFSFSLICATPEQIATSKTTTPAMESSVKLLQHAAPEPNIIRQIVLAEEDSEMRTAIRQALENVGYVVIETADGSQIVDLAAGLLPDMVISSASALGANMWSILQALRNNPECAKIPIIVLGDIPQQADKPVDKLSIKCLAKPVNPEALVSQVKQLFESSVALS
jgi:signal transduction histidine kinase/CheY-like chemotaxis protein